MAPFRPAPTALTLLLGLTGWSCSRPADLVVYCSLDQVHAEKILALFEERSGLKVDPQFDVEQNKTVGLVNRILAESSHPRADVFWNNEIAQTIRLKEHGLTAAYSSPSAEGIPDLYRDPEGHWTGFAARARIILFREDVAPPGSQPPERVADLIQPPYAAFAGMAEPLTGTTLTHMAALCARDGVEPTLAWLRAGLASPLRFGRGNSQVMRRVCEKDLAWCLTDTDDATAAERNGYPVQILYPDQGEGEPGTLLIPNTLCILKGAPHPEAARAFVDFVLSPEVEAMLAASDSRQIPLHAGVAVPPGFQLPGRDFRTMDVDWTAVADQVEKRLPDFQRMFTE